MCKGRGGGGGVEKKRKLCGECVSNPLSARVGPSSEKRIGPIEIVNNVVRTRKRRIEIPENIKNNVSRVLLVTTIFRPSDHSSSYTRVIISSTLLYLCIYIHIHIRISNDLYFDSEIRE